MVELRAEDKVLTNILYNQLQEYTTEVIPQEKLDSFVYTLIEHIRFNSRKNESLIYIDDAYTWDKKSLELRNKDQICSLTNKEKQILSLLFNSANTAVSYEKICYELWNNEISKERIKTLVKQVRRKIPKNLIKNIFGYGYKIEINYKKHKDVNETVK
jgi:DNA-binding response OmpR family regulator